jgi:uncharacterized protein YjbI with pentapeptide repeats
MAQFELDRARAHIEAGEAGIVENQEIRRLELHGARDVTFRAARIGTLVLTKSVLRSGRFDSVKIEHSRIDLLVIRGARLADIVLETTDIGECSVDKSELVRASFREVTAERVSLSRSSVHALTIVSTNIRRLFLSESVIDNSAIAGRIATWVSDRSRFRNVDLGGLDLRNAALGARSEYSNVRFPATSHSFVVPGSAFREIQTELNDRLSEGSKKLLGLLADQHQAPFESVDDGTFAFESDEVNHPFSSAEQSAILSALYARHLESS